MSNYLKQPVKGGSEFSMVIIDGSWLLQYQLLLALEQIDAEFYGAKDNIWLGRFYRFALVKL